MQSWKIDLLSDYRIARILDRHFDKNSYLLELLQENHPTFSEVYSKLSAIKQNLVNSFMEKLGENYENITKDLGNLETIHLDLDEIKKSEKNLKTKLNSLNQEFNQEYLALSNNIPLLEKVYDVSVLSQNSLKFLQNLKLLKSLMVNNKVIDLKKGSMIINELFILAKNFDFSGLSFYENEKDFINNTRENLMSKTKKKFLASLENKQEEEIKTCLKTFANLNILSDVISQTGTNMLKTCMNLWKSFLIKEYDQNTILMSYSQELKNVLNECLSLTTSIWILQNLLRNFENADLISDKNLFNIFELFWTKEITIIAQSFQKLKENANKYEINWKATVRLYPKIFHTFQEFLIKFRENILLYPDFPQITSFENSLNNFMNLLTFLEGDYYIWVKSETESRFLLIINSIFSIENIKSKDYFENIYQNSCKIISFFQYEFADNIKTKEIFLKIQRICFDYTSNFLYNITEKILKANFDETSVNTIFICLNSIAKILSESFNILLLSKHNVKLNLLEFDELLEKYETSLHKISIRFIEKLFVEVLKHFSFMCENHSKSQKFSFQANCWESLNNILTQNNPTKLFNLLEKNYQFSVIWEDFICAIINLYGFLMSSFIMNEKLADIINKDIDFFNNLVEKICRKENLNKISVTIINIHKMFLLDANNMSLLCDSNPNFFDLISKNVLLFNFLKRLEKETNSKLKKPENFYAFLTHFFNTSDFRFINLKELIFGGVESTNCREMLDYLKKNGNPENENANLKIIQKFI